MLFDRFWSKVEVDGSTSCWEWAACKSGSGYGVIGVGGKSERAHRVSYKLHRGEIPSGVNVLHQCDNPGCVNPEHLFLGTQAENIADKVAKGRQSASRGASHYMAKLTEADVRMIRSAVCVSIRELGRQFGVSHSTISRILSGKEWAHVLEKRHG